MGDILRMSILSAFKMHGLSLRSDARKFLTDALRNMNAVETDDWVDKILDQIEKLPLTSNIVDIETLQTAIRDSSNSLNEVDESFFTVIDAFDVPKFSYIPEKKRYVKYSEVGDNTLTILSHASHKADLFRERYNLLLQRTLRHKLFTPPVPGMDNEDQKKFQLRNIEFLLGCSSKVKDIIVLGMLSQMKERKYFLEDLTGAVEMDLSKVKFHTGLFTENCFVLAEGWYEDNIFHVLALGFPPIETSATTRAYYGNVNFFGGNSDLSDETLCRLRDVEKRRGDAMFVILSDVWFDDDEVMKKLETMFIGFQNAPPTCFIFCGNFVSKPYASDHANVLTDSLNNFMKMLLNFPGLCSDSNFLFIPSLDDVGPAKILPRPPLPETVTENFVKKIPNAIFSSNPCRIRYCSQEIVIFCEDIVYKMARNCLKYPSGDISSHFVKTVISQAHLTPLPMEILPIYWQFDQALRLYPLPDLVIVADRQAQSFQETVEVNCKVTNPGSFAKGGFAFKVYYPSSRVVEESKIED